MTKTSVWRIRVLCFLTVTFLPRAMLTANLSSLTPHSSLVFEDGNSTDSDNGTSDEIDGEKKENEGRRTVGAVDDNQELLQASSVLPG